MGELFKTSATFFMFRLSINKVCGSEGFSKKISIFVKFIIVFCMGSVSLKRRVEIRNLQTYAYRYYLGDSRAD